MLNLAMIELEETCIQVLAVIGFLTAAYIFLKFAYKMFHALKVYGFKSYPDFSKYGKWSVVTGSSDGIGKGIAIELASRGQNVVLISRTAEKLKKVAEKISSECNVETKILQIDFSDDEAIYDKIASSLEGLDIGVLVNNVALKSTQAYYHKTPNLSEVIRKTLRIDMISCLKMTQIILPGMVERKRGLIINVSSIGAGIPVVNFSLHGASKTFIDYFTQALSYEYEDKGIIVQTLCPGGVSTPGSNVAPNFFVPSAENYAKSALSTVGANFITLKFWNRMMAPKMPDDVIKEDNKRK